MASSNDFPELHVWGDGSAPGQSRVIDPLSREYLNRYLQTLRSGDAVLDIGCGEGKLLQLLKERGTRSLGIDLNSELVAGCRAAGLPVEEVDVLTALQRHLGDFNVFSMLDFVEHIPLELVLSILKQIAERPGARVWIQTPNLDSLIGMKFWFHMPSHVTALHPFVLRNLLPRCGFEIEAEWTDYGAVPWSGVRRWITLKILNALFGPPLAAMFLQGANICLIAKAVSPPAALPR